MLVITFQGGPGGDSADPPVQVISEATGPGLFPFVSSMGRLIFLCTIPENMYHFPLTEQLIKQEPTDYSKESNFVPHYKKKKKCFIDQDQKKWVSPGKPKFRDILIVIISLYQFPLKTWNKADLGNIGDKILI